MKTLALTLLALLCAPAAAFAATAGADVRIRHGLPVGPVAFRAAPGEANRLTVSGDRGRVVFHDAAAAVHAKGDCEQLDRHTARCPDVEEGMVAQLGDRDDRAHVTFEGIDVHGGSGADRLIGAKWADRLYGDGGGDELHGGRSNDQLTGGPGRDRVYGDRGDDTLVDGETDRQAADDLYRGGDSVDTRNADRGDTIDFSLRRRALRIDLGRHRSSTGDRILGLESIVGGRGGDRLSGDGDDNYLEGQGGGDVLRGRGGRDIPLGGDGDDDVAGGDGDDVVWGQHGQDRLAGGAGGDLLESRDHHDERVDCGSGGDDVESDRGDTLQADCERSHASSLIVQVRPAITADAAIFRVACGGKPGGCAGPISIGAPGGATYGSGTYGPILDGDPETFTDVRVPLTPAGAAALQAGGDVAVQYGRYGGYRTELPASP